MAKILRNQEWRRFDDICDQKHTICIDDIGSEYKTDFVDAKLYEMLCRRQGKWTIITANLSLEQLGDKTDPRISSRLIRHGSVVVEVDVADFNLRVGRTLKKVNG
jgi:DNA replication protein DnaC